MAPDSFQGLSSSLKGNEKPLPKAVALLSAWNAETFIEPTLRSLADQTWPNFEVLVSVDLSTDRTAEICRSFARDDSRFRVFTRTERLGWIKNVNTLFAETDGDYWHIANHDDLLHPSHVETLVALLEDRPGAVLAYPDVRAHYADGSIVERIYTELDAAADAGARARSILRREGHWYNANHSMFRADVSRRIGGLRLHRGGDFCADWPWVLRMAMQGEFVRAPQFLCDKHYKDRSLSLSWRRDLREHLGVLEDCAGAVAVSPLSLREKAALCAMIGREIFRECKRALRTQP